MSAFNSNLGLSGEPGSTPNEFLSVASANGIARVTIAGDPLGNSFALDDLALTSVPEPSTLILIASGLAGLLGWRSVRRFMIGTRV